MDPLSLTAGVLAVIGAAKAFAQGLQKLSGYRKGPREIRDLFGNITELRVFLEGVTVVAEQFQSGQCTQNIHSMVEQVAKAGRKIQEIKSLLDSPAFQISRLSDGNRLRLAWLQHRSKVNKLRDELRAVRIDLGMTLGLLTT